MGSAISFRRPETQSAIDLDAYFSRIGYSGEKKNNLDTLRALHVSHVNAIPFENLNPLAGVPVNLDPDSLFRKLISEQRGGYCFEHNHVFMYALESLGFDVRPLAARVMWNLPEGTVNPRGHMLLLVNLNGSNYIADTGFGGLTLPIPILLKEDIVQVTTHEQFRFVTRSGEYYLQANVNQEWRNLYRFSLEQQVFADFAVANYYLSTHPESHFTKNLIAARVDGEKRYALRNCDFAVHHRGNTSRHTIQSPEELTLLLQEKFSIRLPREKLFESAIKRIVEGVK